MHSQSSGWIAAPLLDKAATFNLNTTKAFLVPMPMEWSMIASHGVLI
jgi:hypothetical protein